MEDDNFQEASNAWNVLSPTLKTFFANESRLKFIIDEAAKLDDVKYYATKDGSKKGIDTVARNMIAKGKSNEEIMDATDLSLEEVNALRTVM